MKRLACFITVIMLAFGTNISHAQDSIGKVVHFYKDVERSVIVDAQNHPHYKYNGYQDEFHVSYTKILVYTDTAIIDGNIYLHIKWADAKYTCDNHKTIDTALVRKYGLFDLNQWVLWQYTDLYKNSTVRIKDSIAFDSIQKINDEWFKSKYPYGVAWISWTQDDCKGVSPTVTWTCGNENVIVKYVQFSLSMYNKVDDLIPRSYPNTQSSTWKMPVGESEFFEETGDEVYYKSQVSYIKTRTCKIQTKDGVWHDVPEGDKLDNRALSYLGLYFGIDKPGMVKFSKYDLNTFSYTNDIDRR